MGKRKSKKPSAINSKGWCVNVDPQRGRHMVSRREFGAGDIVLVERPFVAIVREDCAGEFCHRCFEKIVATSPAAVGSFRLCSTRCASLVDPAFASSVAEVEKTFPAIAAASQCEVDLIRLLAYVAIKGGLAPLPSSAGDEISSDVETTTLTEIQQLQTNRQYFAAPLIKVFSEACSRIHNVIPKEAQSAITPDGLVDVACAINSNSHGLGMHSSNDPVGVGLLGIGSLFNHSCMPNCVFAAGKDGTVVFRAVRYIPKDEEITVAYCDLYQTRDMRRQALLNTKYFTCACVRCNEPFAESQDRQLAGVLCGRKGCQDSVFLPEPTVYRCENCKRTVPLSEVEDVIANATACAERARNIYSTGDRVRARVEFERFMKEHACKLHRMHALTFDVLTPLMNCCARTDDVVGAINHCRTIIACMERSPLDMSLSIANYWENVADLCQHLASVTPPVLATRYSKQAKEALAACVRIRTVCCGADHPLSRSVAARIKG
eukprot:TRINITY_DN532_c0_g1_i1.p2 TRINITY_DN532_c0_g1~~TRINITY_DN532_c0_g1_i1.p2  ORF type:complete len:492 (+),score=56.36 TRINITY_DN532_c0_g1_i1:74-1549(+)